MLLLISGCTGAKQSDNSPPVMNAIDTMEKLASDQKAKIEADAIQQAALQKRSGELNPLDSALPGLVPPQDGTFKVKFETSAGDFVVLVHRDWAPIGAEQFHKLVTAGFYDECRFFRVVPGFMVQWGMNGDPAVNQKWDAPIRDEEVKKSNTKGMMTFAKTGAPHSRTTQVFINFGDNSFLDSDGFSPFAEVIEGMSNVSAIYSGDGERPDQGSIEAQGNVYLKKSFPNLDYIKKASIVE